MEELDLLIKSGLSGAKEALALLNGSDKIFREVLRIVLRQLPERAEGMAEMLGNREFGRFTVEAHGVKNSLASIGALSLSERALELEAKAKAGDNAYCVETFASLHKDLIELYETLKPVVFGEEEEIIITADNKSELLTRLEEIRELLKNFEDDAALRIITALCGRDFGERENALLKELREQADIFNYTEAETTIQELLSIIGAEGLEIRHTKEN